MSPGDVKAASVADAFDLGVRDERAHAHTAGRWEPRWFDDVGLSTRSQVAWGVLGGLAAAGTGYLTAVNPQAAPPAGAVALRVTLIMLVFSAGIYARTSRIQERMGRLLIAAGVLASLWLLNGSSSPLAFSIGRLAGGLTLPLFCALVLSYPTGRLGRSDLRFLVFVGGVSAVAWTALTLGTGQPPVWTPLIRCSPQCPANALQVASAAGSLTFLIPVLQVSLVALSAGTGVVLLLRRRVGAVSVGRSVTLLAAVMFAYAALTVGWIAARHVGSPVAGGLGTAAVASALIVPLAILFGLMEERVSVGQALADFLTALMRMPHADPQQLMSDALHDPSLQIAYRRPGSEDFVELSGKSVPMGVPGEGRAVAWVERDHVPLAAVIYSDALEGQNRFVEAAAAGALLRLERAQLEAGLRASTASLAASRIRLVESAYAERQRIERDLHDSVQQDLVAARIRLDMALEKLRTDPADAAVMVESLGHQLDDLLEALRSVARGIYPSLLDQHGLTEALKSTARRSPIPVKVVARDVSRYSSDAEVAVYFCCLEALQNVVKHAGRNATATVRLWEERNQLCFRIRDTGSGFDSDALEERNGLLNMQDRIEAVGGWLDIVSRPGRGTLVHGSVPVTQAEVLRPPEPTPAPVRRPECSPDWPGTRSV